MKNIVLYKYLLIVFIFFSYPVNTNSVLDIQNKDFVIGDKNAPITIIEYASLSCHHCADFHLNTLPKLIEEYVETGKAGGAVLGGAGLGYLGGYAVCSVVFGLPSGGTSLLWCGIVAGGAGGVIGGSGGGYAGGVAGELIYEVVEK